MLVFIDRPLRFCVRFEGSDSRLEEVGVAPFFFSVLFVRERGTIVSMTLFSLSREAVPNQDAQEEAPACGVPQISCVPHGELTILSPEKMLGLYVFADHRYVIFLRFYVVDGQRCG